MVKVEPPLTATTSMVWLAPTGPVRTLAAMTTVSVVTPTHSGTCHEATVANVLVVLAQTVPAVVLTNAQLCEMASPRSQ